MIVSSEAQAEEVVNLALVQLCWRPDTQEHADAIHFAVAEAAAAGADLVALPELTLHPYFPAAPHREDLATQLQEPLETGPTVTLCRELAKRHHVHIVGSLYECGGYNTAVVVGRDGNLLGTCRKQHIPGTDGYAERLYFRSGGDTQDYPVFELELGGRVTRVACPTCYDQVLLRW
jgi:N-carbamoylputrescine amidase